jgi:polysaccharide export outer membrane protein
MNSIYGAQVVKLLIWTLALLTGLFVTGASAAEPVTKKSPDPVPTQPMPQPVLEAEYLLSPEDILEISVWKEETLTKQVVIRPDGAFSFPLVGDVQATAKTVEKIRGEIKERLKKYIPEPVVSVSLLKVTGYKIYVIGRVNKPGEFVTGRFVDVLQALAMAGGLTPFAAENDIRILRRVEGNEYVRNFRYADVRKGQHLEQNILLQSGDTVVVP